MSNTTAPTEKPKEKAPFDPKRDALAREKLVTARIALLLKAPFFGNLATRMRLINADEWLTTAATDGRHFYYNTEFVLKLPPRQLEFLVGHEVLHAVYDHCERGRGHHRTIGNIAADYVVNSDLIDQKIGERITVVPILYEPKYRGMTYEEVYEDLMKNAKKISIEDLEKMLLDEHLEGEGEGEGDGEGKDDKGRPKMSAAERQAIRDEVREAVLQAAQQVGAGNLPAGVKRLIKDLTQSVINWRELLQQQIESTIKADYTWMRPSRKGWHMDAIIPATTPGNMVDVCIGIDMSGSIGEADAKAFLSEIRGIMEAYEEYRIHVWSFDTKVYNPQVFVSDNLEDIASYEPVGGGGTDFMANWQFMKDEDIQPKKFIMFTDGYPYGEWGDENYCDTCWVIKGNPNAEPPFGIWANYDEEARKQ
jgi:predicted metal-dependent peptidase